MLLKKEKLKAFLDNKADKYHSIDFIEKTPISGPFLALIVGIVAGPLLLNLVKISV